jgi:hypothetical protein
MEISDLDGKIGAGAATAEIAAVINGRVSRDGVTAFKIPRRHCEISRYVVDAHALRGGARRLIPIVGFNDIRTDGYILKIRGHIITAKTSGLAMCPTC